MNLLTRLFGERVPVLASFVIPPADKDAIKKRARLAKERRIRRRAAQLGLRLHKCRNSDRYQLAKVEMDSNASTDNIVEPLDRVALYLLRRQPDKEGYVWIRSLNARRGQT